MKQTLLFSLLVFSQLLIAQPFIPDVAGFPGVANGSIAFADTDGDGNEDVFVTGRNRTEIGIAKLYANDGAGNFTEMMNTPFLGVTLSAAAFADVDGDGNEDILMSGQVSSTLSILKLYTNDGTGNFTEMVNTSFVGVNNGRIAFSDVDGDNDLDVLVTGRDAAFVRLTKLYINDGEGTFTEMMDTSFPGVDFSSIAFADVDGDNDEDIFLTGFSVIDGGLDFEMIAKLYANDGMGNFTEVANTPFPQVNRSAVAFADVDSDGDQDLLITGEARGSTVYAKLYLNDGTGSFSEATGMPFKPVKDGAVTFQDFDEDGDQDLLITGIDEANDYSAGFYTNDGTGNFSEEVSTFVGAGISVIAVSDIDGDTDLDVVISGVTNQSGVRSVISYLYINNRIFVSTNDIKSANEHSFSVYPNPGSCEITSINYHADTSGKLSISIINFDGKVVSQQYAPVSSGWNTIDLQLKELAKGMYLVNVSDGLHATTQKLIVQ